jgi:hypothetical protein
MNKFVIHTSIGYLKHEEFIEIHEKNEDTKKRDNLFVRKIKKLFNNNNKIYAEELI